MFPELLLGFVLIAASGAFFYLWHDHEKTKRARSEEREAKRRDFRELLVRELRRTAPSGFAYDDFAASCEVDDETASQVAEDLYRQLAEKVVADGIVTDEERRRLDSLAGALMLPTDRVQAIEAGAKSEAYREAVKGVLADGVVTAEEALGLNSLRRSLGLGREEAAKLSGELSRSAYVAALRDIVGRGRLSAEDRSHLRRIKDSFSASDAGSMDVRRVEAVSIYRECLTNILQEGEISSEQESLLTWIQREVGLSNGDVKDDCHALARAKTLAKFRRGELPVIPSKMMLEGGETCHFTIDARTLTRRQAVP